MLQETLAQDALLQEVKLKGSVGLTETNLICPNCQTLKVGPICHQCGAEKMDKHELTLKHFLHHSLHEFTHVEDSKILRTLTYLLFKPGKLTTEYFAGRKIRYISPIRLYLIAFALSFFVYSNFETIAFYDVQTYIKMYPPLGEKLKEVAVKKGMALVEFTLAVNKKWHQYISLSHLSYAVLLASTLKLAFRKRFFVEHTVFSLHFSAFTSLLTVLICPLYFVSGGIAQNTANNILSAISFLVIGAYLVTALKEIFSPTWKNAFLHAAWLIVVYYLVSSVLHFLTLAFAIAYAS